MAEMWKPLSIEDYLGWIEAIVDEASDDLSDWESTFIESLNQRLNNNQNLTELQAKKLESIYSEKTK